MYGNYIQKLENLKHSVANLLKGNIKYAIDKVWLYFEISKDGRLSLADIEQFQRNIVKFAAVNQDKNAVTTEEITAINLASIILITNNGFISPAQF